MENSREETKKDLTMARSCAVNELQRKDDVLVKKNACKINVEYLVLYLISNCM